jgi:cobalamin biosynthesis protein CbiD
MFLLSLVMPDGGSPLVFPGGGRVEIDLVETVIDKVAEKGIGWGHGKTAVKNAVREAIQEAIYELKRESVKFV